MKKGKIEWKWDKRINKYINNNSSIFHLKFIRLEKTVSNITRKNYMELYVMIQEWHWVESKTRNEQQKSKRIFSPNAVFLFIL